MEIPAKPSSKDAVACVGELVGGEFVGCSRSPVRLVVGIVPKKFGMGDDVEDGEWPSVKVCGVCSRHLEALVEQMGASSPGDQRNEPMVFTVRELLAMWDDFFEDVLSTLGGGEDWDAEYTRFRR